MSGVKNLAMAENKGLKPITNELLKEEGMAREKEKRGERY